jgi:PAS domain S-box-containing protein
VFVALSSLAIASHAHILQAILAFLVLLGCSIVVSEGYHQYQVFLQRKEVDVLAFQRQESAIWVATFENAFDAMIAVNEHGYITASNRAVTKILGYEPSEIKDRHIAVLMPPSADRAAYSAAFLKPGATSGKSTGLEVQAIRKDGKLVDIELGVSRAERHGKAIFVGILRDLTPSRDMERSKSFVRARVEFVAAVSHEVRIIIILTM